VGELLQKIVNHMLKMVLDDNLASLFNWKGQRENKQSLSKRRISKIIIGNFYIIYDKIFFLRNINILRLWMQKLKLT